MTKEDVNEDLLYERFESLPLNTKLTPKLIEDLKREIARGLPLKWAKKVVGISDTAYYTWYKKGKESTDEEDPYRIFFKEMEKAKALAVGSRVDAIRKAGEGNSWQAAAWWLERMDHDNFGKKSTIDANVNANVKQINLADLFDKEELKSIIEEEKEDEEDLSEKY